MLIAHFALHIEYDNASGGGKTMREICITVMIISLLTVGFIAGCGGDKEEAGMKEKAARVEEEASVEEAAVPGEEAEEVSTARPLSNTPPHIVSAKILPDPPYTDTDLEVEVEATDAESDFLTFTYQWLKTREGETPDTGVELEDETNPTLSHELFTGADALAVIITPSDGDSEGVPYRTKYVIIGNAPPRIISEPPEVVPSEGVYIYQVKAEDPDGDPLTFSLSEAPEGMSIDAETGLISWPISPGAVGTHKVCIDADDGNYGTCAQHYELILEYKQILPEEE
jgi:hypothetical protein